MKFLTLILSLVGTVNLHAQKVSPEKNIIDAATTKQHHAKEYTLLVAEAMPEAGYQFKPAVEEMDFGAQLMHLADNMKWLCTAYLGAKKEIFPIADSTMKSKQAIIEYLTKAYDASVQTLQDFDVKTLSDSVKFFAGPMNKLQILNLLNDHQTHHRAQMLVYLRMREVTPPKYVGW